MRELMQIMVGGALWSSLGILGMLIVVFGCVALWKNTKRQLIKFWRAASWHGCTIMFAAAILATMYGGSKIDLRARSSADDGIALVSVIAENTNGTTHISATYTGGEEIERMWYRNFASNVWLSAEADGFELEYSAYFPEQGVHSNEWTRAEAEFTPYAMYWFGDNPPPVEVVSVGGVFIDGWRGSGRGVEVDWHVDETIEIKEGTRVVLEYGAARAAFGEAADAELTPGGGRSGTLSVQGWFVGFVTYWRLKLEVPQ